MNHKNSWCSAHGWSVSVTTGSGIKGAIASVAKFKKTASGRHVMQKGALYGKEFANRDDAFKAMHEHGHGSRYSRNSCGFVMSRAARKRGYTTTNFLYTNAVKRYENHQA